MPQPIPYLAFNGQCEQAMRFYERVLNGKLEKIVRYADSPHASQTPAEHLQRVMHARLLLEENGTLYGGDCPPSMPYEGIKGVTLTLNYDSVEDAQRVFNALADGGNVTMNMQATFWATSCGMLIDRFGTPWVVNGALLPL